MEDNSLLKTSDKRCPECGRFIEYGYMPIINREIFIKCACVIAKEEKERLECIAKGDLLIRSKMLEFSGLKKKQRGVNIYNIQPRKGQEEAYNYALQFIEKFKDNPNAKGFIYAGGVGSGKTFISSAIANAVIDTIGIDKVLAESVGRFGEYSKTISPVCFTGTVELVEQLKATYNSNSVENTCDVMNRLKHSKLLILDDMGAENPSEWVKERLFEIIDYRSNEDLPIIITTNAIPSELKSRIGERSFDRLREMCHYIKFASQSQRQTAKY